ncbi:MAG: 7-cyano-7-deazaguanine synthase QueC [Methylococcus sp.]|nr:MAG: 7-cyano-7-deazaguanine synthase QueC [Methylococcus sp.]
MKLGEKPKAVILLSGGLDSITALVLARKQGFECHALSFDYGQRHNAELVAARRIAAHYSLIEHRVMQLGLGSIGGSALTDESIDVPQEAAEGIPVTYVPARNTVFLALALGWAEVLEAHDIFVGVNAVDYSGYPDCRPEYIEAFQAMANLATRAGVEGAAIRINAPLIQMSKADIVRMGTEFGVDYSMTVSCYAADSEGRGCRSCDACRLRSEGFQSAGIHDPTRYR